MLRSSEKNSHNDKNLLRPILWVVGSVLIYIILHYWAKSLLFSGVRCRSKENEDVSYKDINELKIDAHPETRALIAYKTGEQNEENKSKTDTIVLSFHGVGSDGRVAINAVRVGGEWVWGRFVNGKWVKCCHGVDCNLCKKKHFGGKLFYDTASIIPRGFYSNQNILKKVYITGENPIYEDAENLYDCVTDVLGYKNVIINGFCQGGPVAAHVVKYAEKKAEKEGGKSKVIGLVLNGPMDGIYSSYSKAVRYAIWNDNIFGRIFGPIFGFIAKLLLPFTGLDTYENLKNVKNKSLPIICFSGGDEDFLNNNRIHMKDKLKNVGFENVEEVMFEEFRK